MRLVHDQVAPPPLLQEATVQALLRAAGRWQAGQGCRGMRARWHAGSAPTAGLQTDLVPSTGCNPRQSCALLQASCTPPCPRQAAPVTLKQRVACEHDVEGRGLHRHVDVPLGWLLLGHQVSVLARPLLVNVKLVVCRGGGRQGRQARMFQQQMSPAAVAPVCIASVCRHMQPLHLKPCCPHHPAAPDSCTAPAPYGSSSMPASSASAAAAASASLWLAAASASRSGSARSARSSSTSSPLASFSLRHGGVGWAEGQMRVSSGAAVVGRWCTRAVLQLAGVHSSSGAAVVCRWCMPANDSITAAA